MAFPPTKDGSAKKEPKGALVALLSGAPDSTDSTKPETDHGFRAVAKAFGIPPEREASAQAALKQYIKACVGSQESSLDEEY
jgi:hypothetical protein